LVSGFNRTKKQKQQQAKIQLISDLIDGKKNELRILEDSLVRRGQVNTLIKLLNMCGAETKALSCHPKVTDILNASKEREQIVQQIKKMEDDRDKLQEYH